MTGLRDRPTRPNPRILRGCVSRPLTFTYSRRSATALPKLRVATHVGGCSVKCRRHRGHRETHVVRCFKDRIIKKNKQCENDKSKSSQRGGTALKNDIVAYSRQSKNEKHVTPCAWGIILDASITGTMNTSRAIVRVRVIFF